jgi:tetratricopeptide (TPR) repeat protein
LKLQFRNRKKFENCGADKHISKLFGWMIFLVVFVACIASICQATSSGLHQVASAVELSSAEENRDLDHDSSAMGITLVSSSPESQEQLAATYFGRGDSLFNAGRCNESLDAINQGLEIAPMSDYGYNGLGNTLECLGRSEESIAAYDKAIALLNQTAPSDSINLAIYLTNKGSSLDTLGRYEEAIQEYDKAIRLDPNYTSPYINKGVSLGNLGRYEEAIQEYDEAIRLDPNDTLTHTNKASDLYNLGRYGEAIQEYDEAIRLDPTYVDAYNGKGDALTQLGREDESLAQYDIALSISSGNVTNKINQTSSNATEVKSANSANQTSSLIVNELRQLHDLKQGGVITEQEFQDLKQDIIGKYLG